MQVDQQQRAAEGQDGTTGTKSGRGKAAGQQHKLRIDLLKIIHAARQTYGLRTNDYARYHAHAARRVATLHRATNTSNKPSSKKNALPAGKSKKAGGGSGSGSTANRAAYTSTTSQISAESVLKDERLLELLLWETERAWSEGMKQREEIASLERANMSQALAAKRHRAVKRFQRASEHSAKLSALARTLYKMPNAPLSAAAACQIEIYRHYMQGTLGFVRATSPGDSTSSVYPSPSLALSALGSAYVLLESYAQATTHATEEAIAFELLDELEPLIRFCSYKAGIDNVPPAETARKEGKDAIKSLEASDRYPNVLGKLAKEESAYRKNRSSIGETVNHLSWRDIDLPIRNAELAELLGRVNRAIAQIERKSSSKGRRITSTSTYDRALAMLIEAEDKARKLVDDNSVALARAHSSRFEAAAKPLGLVHSYILFHLLAIRLQRDEALVNATMVRLARREATFSSENTTFGPVSMRVKRRRMKLYPVLIKLLDGMTQSLERMRSLPVVEDDSVDLAEETDALLAYTRARRCLYLGETYAMLDKYGQALTLLQRGTLYVRQTSSTLDSLEPGESAALTTLTSARDDVPLLMKRLERAEARASRDWHNYTVSSQPSGGPITGDDSLALAVEHISLQRQIIGERAKKTGKVGPIFFDVAFNYIAPVRTDSPAQELETDEPGHGEAVIATDHPTQEYASSDRKSSSHTASEQQSTGRGIWGFFGRRK